MKVELEPVAVRGFRFAGVSAGLKSKAGALDLGLIAADRPAAAAAVFSANRVKAAPVYVTADRVKSGRLQAVVANSGCDNSFTGAAGMRLARDSCAEVGRLLGCAPELRRLWGSAYPAWKVSLARLAFALREHGRRPAQEEGWRMALSEIRRFADPRAYWADGAAGTPERAIQAATDV